MSYYCPYNTLSLLSRSVMLNTTLLLPLLPLRRLLLRLLLLLLLLPPLLPRLLLLDSPAFCLPTTPSTRRSPSCPRIDCYCSNSCSFTATDFLLSSAFPSPSSLDLQIIFFSGLQQCLRFMLSWFMASQELRPWRGASCHEHVVIAIGFVLN